MIVISSAIGRSSRTASAIGATSSGSSRSTKICTRAAAREADLEGLLVGDPVGLEPRRAAREHLAGLAVDGGLDAAAGDRAGDLALLGHGQDGAGVAGSRALGADHGGDRDRGPVGRPALEGLENVSHEALRPL